VIHRRINAARNVASKDTIPLEIRET